MCKKVCRHGASTADQPGRRGGSGRLIFAQLESTSTSFLKSDHWSLFKKEVEVKWLNFWSGIALSTSLFKRDQWSLGGALPYFFPKDENLGL